MRNIIKYMGVIFSGLLVVSCFEDIPPVEQFDVVTSNYNIASNSTYYKIHQNGTIEISNSVRGGWDLAFQSALIGDHVLTNYTSAVKAIKTGTSVFEDVDVSTLEDLLKSDQWKFNDPAYSNIKDSLALKDWETKEVYIINRGIAQLPQNRYYKIQFESKNNDSYTFKYAGIESNSGTVKTVNRNSNLVNVTFSFDEGNAVDFEPGINDWDFFLTPYLGWYETLTAGEFAEYNLTGVMINNESGLRVAAIDDEDIIYEDIDLTFAQSQNYTDWKGVIGSTWKKIPSTENPLYEMDTNKKYIFKHTDGKYYKLRFTSFYNDAGEQGYPSFEIKKL